MAIVRLSPHREMALLSERLNRLFGTAEGYDEGEEGMNAGWAPVVDIFEDNDGIILSFELPGMTREEIDVQVSSNVLTVRGERKLAMEEKRDRYSKIERAYGQFVRSFTLPATVDGGQVAARYEKGILRVQLPKKEMAKPKKISVDIG